MPEDVTLAQLCDACVSPARTLLRDGLGVRLPGEVERVDHAIPLSVDKLQAAFIGRRLLERYGRHAGALRVDGGTADGWEAAARAAVEEWAEAERLAGGRPPGRLIDDTLSSVAAEIDAIAVAAECSGLDRVAILGADGVVDVDLELKVSGALTGRRAGAQLPPARRSRRRDRRRGALPARLPAAEAADDHRRRARPRRRRCDDRRLGVACAHRHPRRVRWQWRR